MYSDYPFAITVRATWCLDTKFFLFVTECTNYLSQPLMENGKPFDPAYEVNIASEYNKIVLPLSILHNEYVNFLP